MEPNPDHAHDERISPLEPLWTTGENLFLGTIARRAGPSGRNSPTQVVFHGTKNPAARAATAKALSQKNAEAGISDPL
jgi:hypothetical protein